MKKLGFFYVFINKFLQSCYNSFIISKYMILYSYNTRSTEDNSDLYMKKLRMKKNYRIAEQILVIIPFLLVLTILSRTIPDGVIRLNIGESGIGEKAIALTFDDGPSGYTEELLDGLEKYDAKVTFFVIGKNAEKNPEIVKRAHEDGHLIGNHTYSHIDFYKSTLSEIKEDINKGDEVIKSIIGKKPLFLRAPYGNVSFIQLKQLDRFFINWSETSLDWFREEEEYIYKRIMKEAEDGEIILMHDTREVTVKAALRAIPELQEQGYEFVRVDELLSRNGGKLKMGVPYRSCKYDRGAVAF